MLKRSSACNVPCHARCQDPAVKITNHTSPNGLYKGYIGVILGFYTGDNGKENGNCYNGLYRGYIGVILGLYRGYVGG